MLCLTESDDVMPVQTFFDTWLAMERLPEELTKYFSGKNLMIIFPDQFGEDKTDVMTFAEPQHVEDRSAYEALLGWLYHNLYHRLAVAAKKIIRKTKKK